MSHSPASTMLTRLVLLLGFALPIHASITWEKTDQAIEVRRGDKDDVPATFVFRNTGAQTVTITGVSTTCGCVQATPESSRVAPGATGTIWAFFTIGARTGRQEKTLLVGTDDPTAPQTKLTLTVTILEPKTDSGNAPRT